MPITIPASAPGAPEAAKSMRDLTDAVTAAQKAADEAKRGTAEYDQALQDVRAASKAAEKAEREHALALGGSKAALADAAKAYAAVGTAALAGIAGVTGFAAASLRGAASHEQEMRAVNALGGAYARVQAATGGVIEAQQALQAQQSLVQSGLRVSDGELEAITRKAREYALATGGDATQALEQLTDALRGGEAEGLRKYGIAVDATKSRTHQFHDSLRDLQKAQADTAAAQTTLNEEMGKTPGLVGSLVSSMANDVAQVFGFGDAIRGLNRELTEFRDNARRAEKDAEGIAVADARMKVNENVEKLRAAGVGEDVLGTVDTTHMTRKQLEKMLSLTGDIESDEAYTAGMDVVSMNARGGLGGRLLARRQAHGAMTAAAVASRMRRMNLTNDDLKAMMEGNDAADLAAREGNTEVGPDKEVDRKGAAVKPTGADPAAMEEAARAFQKFTDTIHENREQLTGMMRQEGESTKEFLVRAAGAAENLWVDYEDRAIRHRGESEIEFAKRRIEIAEKAQQAIAENQRKLDEENAKIADEIEKAHDKKAADRLHREVAAITQIASVRKEMEGHGKASAADELGEKLARGETTLDTLEARLKAIGMEAAHSAAANDNGKLEALNAEAAAIGHVAGAERDRVRAQRESIDLSKQMGRAMLDFVGVNKTGEKSIADFATNALGKLTSGMQAHFGALIEGKETVGVALKGMLHDTLAALAQEAFPKAIMETAAGIAALASIALAPTAPGHFAAAGMYAAVAALGGLAASATATQAAPAASNAATAGANGGRTPNTGHAANDNAGGPTVININYSNMAFETSHQVGQQVHYILSDLGRRGVVSREYMVAGMRGMR